MTARRGDRATGSSARAAIAERALGRIGDVLLFPRGAPAARGDHPAARTARRSSSPAFRGLHGGLTEDEALVPLLAVRV